MFGSKSAFVPLSAAEMQGEDVLVPFDKELVKGAPHVDAEGELSLEEEQRLYSHYGVTGGATTQVRPHRGLPQLATPALSAGHNTLAGTVRDLPRFRPDSSGVEHMQRVRPLRSPIGPGPL